jgi:hypothetical protein
VHYVRYDSAFRRGDRLAMPLTGHKAGSLSFPSLTIRSLLSSKKYQEAENNLVLPPYGKLSTHVLQICAYT